MTEIEFTVGEADCVAFANYHATQSPSLRRRYRLLRFGFAALWLAFALFELLVAHSVAAAVVWLLLALGWTFLLPRSLRRSRRRTTLRMYREGRNTSLFGRHILRAEVDGLVHISANGEAKVRWAGVEKMVTDGDRVFLYLTAVSAIVVPRGQVLRGDYAAFVAELQTHLALAAA